MDRISKSSALEASFQYGLKNHLYSSQVTNYSHLTLPRFYPNFNPTLILSQTVEIKYRYCSVSPKDSTEVLQHQLDIFLTIWPSLRKFSWKCGMKKPKLGKGEQTARVFGTEYDWVDSRLDSSVTNN